MKDHKYRLKTSKNSFSSKFWTIYSLAFKIEPLNHTIKFRSNFIRIKHSGKIRLTSFLFWTLHGLKASEWPKSFIYGQFLIVLRNFLISNYRRMNRSWLWRSYSSLRFIFRQKFQKELLDWFCNWHLIKNQSFLISKLSKKLWKTETILVIVKFQCNFFESRWAFFIHFTKGNCLLQSKDSRIFGLSQNKASQRHNE